METAESEECAVGKKGANALLTGAVDFRHVVGREGERDIVDNTHRYSTEFEGVQPMQNQDSGEHGSHTFPPSSAASDAGLSSNEEENGFSLVDGFLSSVFLTRVLMIFGLSSKRKLIPFRDCSREERSQAANDTPPRAHFK